MEKETGMKALSNGIPPLSKPPHGNRKNPEYSPYRDNIDKQDLLYVELDLLQIGQSLDVGELIERIWGVEDDITRNRYESTKSRIVKWLSSKKFETKNGTLTRLS
jgi:hypothetical protein